jgi:hypothetical protein
MCESATNARSRCYWRLIDLPWFSKTPNLGRYLKPCRQYVGGYFTRSLLLGPIAGVASIRYAAHISAPAPCSPNFAFQNT